MAIKGFEKKDPYGGIKDLLAVMNQFSQMGARTESRLASKTAALGVQIASANTSEEIENLANLINKHNQDTTRLGHEEYSLKNPYEEKQQVFGAGDIAYKEAETYFKENNFLTKSSEDLSKEIWSMNWDEMTQEISDLNKINNKIQSSQASGQKYYSSDGVSGSSLQKSIKDRIGMLNSKMHIWEENSGNFLVFDAQGNMDEASLAMYENFKFKILSGDYEGFKTDYASAIKDVKEKYEKNSGDFGYIDFKSQQAKAKNLLWGELQDSIKSDLQEAIGKKNVTEASISQSLLHGVESVINLQGRDAIVDPVWFQDQKKVASGNADKYNNQFKLLTGELIDEDVPWRTFTEKERIIREAEKSEKEAQEAKERKEDEEGATSELDIMRLKEGAEAPKLDVEYEAGAVSEETQGDIETNFNNYIESEASSEGIDYKKLTSRVATGVILTGAAASNETIQNVGKTIYKATKDGAKYLNTAYNLSGKDIKTIMSAVNDPKGNINRTLKRIDGLQKQLNSLKKDPHNVKRLQIKNRINDLRKTMVESLSSRLTKAGSKVRPEDVARLMSNKEMSKWNPVKVKDFLMNKSPGATKKWLAKSKIAGAGKGLLRFRTGSAIKDALGIDIGEGFAANVAEDIATTSAATGILNQAGKRFIPKLRAIVNSPTGRKAITKFAGKQLGKNLIRQAAGTSVPLVGNIAMAITGAGLSVWDFIKFVKSFKEE